MNRNNQYNHCGYCLHQYCNPNHSYQLTIKLQKITMESMLNNLNLNDNKGEIECENASNNSNTDEEDEDNEEIDEL